jgi:ATP-dependent Clp protease ATP-binding subunit ClpA
MGVDVDKLHKNIERKLIKEKDDFVVSKIKNKDIPIEKITALILKNAENECDIMGDTYLDTQHILLATLKVKNNVSSIMKGLKISYTKYKKGVVNAVAPIDNEGEPEDEAPKGKSSSKNKSTPILDNFSIDITKRASEGKIDPVIGRDESIQRVAQILSRKKKNNPIIIGEPGVGKFSP